MNLLRISSIKNIPSVKYFKGMGVESRCDKIAFWKDHSMWGLQGNFDETCGNTDQGSLGWTVKMVKCRQKSRFETQG